MRLMRSRFTLLGLILILFTPVFTWAYDLNEKLSLAATLTGLYQYGNINWGKINDPSRGVGVFDLGLNFHPTENDEFQLTGSYTDQNGLNGVSPFVLSPYADDLRDDLRQINGRDRSYLLEAWYKHKFALPSDITLALTGGIIDATCYLDDNAFANNEVTQFMNDIFVNNTLANLPSYDYGGVIELEKSNLSLRLVKMMSKTEEKRDYHYQGFQLGYQADTPLGEGSYRIYGFLTDKEFLDRAEKDKESLRGGGISLDQKLGEIIGVFSRLGWQDDKAAVDHDQVYSFGLNVNGKLWGREKDEIGLGYAYLKGAAKSDLNHTNATEMYIKFSLNNFSDLTLDVQYLKDRIKNEDDPDGFIYGLRLNTYF